MAREHPLVAEVRRTGGAFVSDTAPLVYRLERSAAPPVLAAVDALFDTVEGGELGCFVSSLSAAELLVRPYRIGAPAVTDGFLRGPNIGLVRPSLGVAHGAARLVARRILPRRRGCDRGGDGRRARSAAGHGGPPARPWHRRILVQDFALQDD